MAQPAEDFPTVPKVEAKKGVTFPLDLWKRLTRKVLYAVSAEETRFQLMGALLKDKGKEYELVATDGHRLALINFPKEDAKATIPNVLIPKKALAEILKMDGGADARLEIRHSENHLLFTVGNRQLVARLLDVNFPDYEKILSKNNDRVAIAPTTRHQGRDSPRFAVFLGALAWREALFREGTPDRRFGQPGARRRNTKRSTSRSKASRFRSA